MRTVVFCLPFAGGGAGLYRGWPQSIADDGQPLTLHPVQLPGREELFDEPLPDSFAAVVGGALSQVLDAAADDDRVVLFGHSFGAVVAFEVARRLAELYDWPPRHLIVSGSVDPTAPMGRDSSGLGDDEFVARVEELSGYRHPALADPELRDILLPVLRSDVRMHEAYREVDVEPIPVPVKAVRGAQDHLVSRADCAGWSSVTSAGCEVVELPGGHMYLTEDSTPLLRLLSRALAAEPTASREQA